MTIEVRNGNTYMTADEGKFLSNESMTLYGVEIVLGKYDSPDNYFEHPMYEWPVIEEPEKPTIDPNPDNPNGEEQVIDDNDIEPTPERLLFLAKESKLREIEAYDTSTHVNGFYLNGNLMWLDRETRASLRNTIESSILVGREYLDIWFGETHVNVSINDARMMLAVLEVYATDCYNVTSQHKITVKAMDNIEDVETFDVTNGYPTMPSF